MDSDAEIYWSPESCPTIPRRFLLKGVGGLEDLGVILKLTVFKSEITGVITFNLIPIY